MNPIARKARLHTALVIILPIFGPRDTDLVEYG